VRTEPSSPSKRPEAIRLALNDWLTGLGFLPEEHDPKMQVDDHRPPDPRGLRLSPLDARTIGEGVQGAPDTLTRAEFIDSEAAITIVQAQAIQRALESAGVEFTNGDQPGVRLRVQG